MMACSPTVFDWILVVICIAQVAVSASLYSMIYAVSELSKLNAKAIGAIVDQLDEMDR